MTIRHKGRVISGNYQAGGTLDNFYATTDLDNLSDKGNEKINSKLPSKDFYNKITNCITELPQRIKYTLEGGVLTMKAGSVFIIPNGPTNLRWPEGVTTPINETYITRYSQYEDDRYFVWAQSLQDATLAIDSTASGTFLVFPCLHEYLVMLPISSVSSGDTPPTVSDDICFYNTTTNYISYGFNDAWHTDWIGFPILKITCESGVITSIDQVFNGRGYIGSHIWLDIGVKGLIPDGRNTNETLNNIEIETSKLTTYTGELTGDIELWLDSEGTIQVRNDVEYDEQLNKICVVDSTETMSYCNIGSAILTAGVVEVFAPRQTIALATKDDVEGSWVVAYLSIYDGSSTTTGTKTADLSSYLPDDGHDYEVLLTGYLNNNTDTYGQISVKPHYNSSNVVALVSSGNGGRYDRNWIPIIIGKDRTLTYSFSAKLSSVTCQMQLLRYKRVV